MIQKQNIFFQSDGYTLLESLITIFIFSLLSLIAYNSLSRVQIYANNCQDKLLYNLDVLKLRLVLTREFKKVKNPWFLPKYQIKKEDSKLIFYYYNGIPSESITLTKTNNRIIVSCNNKTLFQSEYLLGYFDFEDGFIKYIEDDLSITIPLGIILV